MYMFTADENIKNTNHNTTVVSHGTKDWLIDWAGFNVSTNTGNYNTGPYNIFMSE